MGTSISRHFWLAFACLLLPSLASAAGLGKLTVHSALGHPLKAEIEVVSLQPGEADSLTAKLAPVAAFRQADIEFNAALQSVRFAVERRPGGRFVVVLTSVQPLNEPFFDMLVEMNWANGKLVREYTFLLDPPEYRMPTLAAPGRPAAPIAQTVPVPAEAAPPAAARPVVAVPQAAAPAPQPVDPAPQAAAPAPAPEAVAPAEPAQQLSQAASPAPDSAEPSAEAAAPSAEAAASSAEAATSPTEAPTSVQAAPEAVKPPEERALVPESLKTYEVKRGDTLAKIALRNKIEGVTLQQMLVALFRANQEAFMGDNMNRLRAGKILTIPGKEEASVIGNQDARRLVTAQTTDFVDYRRSLGLAVAQAPARADAGRQASGKIGDGSEQQPPPPKEPAKDQLRLSRADEANRGGKAAGGTGADDLAAKEKALKEANERVAMLEKNVADMQKLLEVKSSTAAQIQQQAQAAKAAPSTPAAKAAPSTPAAKAAPSTPAAKAAPETPSAKTAPSTPAAKSSEPVPAAKAPAPAAKAAEPAPKADAPKAAEPTQIAEAAKTGDAGKAEAAKAAPEAPKAPAVATAGASKGAAKASPKAPPPPASIDLVDDLLASEYTLPGSAGLVVVLLGYAAYAWRKKKRQAGPADGMTGALASDANSVFGTSGGQNIDTGSSSFQSDFSQSGIGKVDTEEIDPIAEADVYMAYGRDAQAEEILKEALVKDSGRPVIRLKLLEIYANRKDTKAFETAANELRAATGGQGPEWDKALSLGAAIDPQNPLYGGRAGGEITRPDTPRSMAAVMPDLVLPVTEAPAPALDFNLDLGGGPAGGAAEPDITLDVGAPAAEAALGGLDFDLGLGGDKPAEEKSDFSPGGTLIIDHAPSPEPAPAADAPLNFDFDLPGMEKSAPASPAPAARAPAAAASADGSIEFDLGLPDAAPPQPDPARAPQIDLAAISLDMDVGTAPAAGAGAATDARWQEVATKLDLAKAYDEMGDKDGARELLKEVVREGDSAQQQRAQTMLQALA